MLNVDIFRDPPSKYRPMPFWFWNSKLSPEKIRAQIHDFKAKGLGGFFIHARFGLETEYLSDEWMNCCRTAVQAAQETGLEVWLYDENGFPSGIGDLKVSRIKDYRPKFIILTEIHCDEHGYVRGTLPAGERVLASGYPANCAYVAPEDLTKHIIDDNIEWKAPDKNWKASIYTKCTIEDPNDVVYGVDYLNAEAMKAFFDMTLTPYQNALGEYFGNVIKGIFTDEPTLLPWHHNGMWYCQLESARLVPWNDAIAEDMNALHNLSPAEYLPHLFYDIDSATGHLRRLFQRSTVKLYKQSFFQPYKEWCEKNSLKLTGHFLLEEGLFYNTIFEADPFPTLSMFDIPGTDHLGDVTEHGYYEINNLPVEHTNITGRKLAVSAAHLSEKRTVISESFGCSGWGLKPERAKLMTDWQYSLGVNMLCPHALFYSIEGFRKNDAPPAHNFLPSWNCYKTFADYVGRLSYALQHGNHRARAALYYPIQEFHSAYAPAMNSENARLISDCFDACCSILPRLHLDYDIISDKLLTGCSVSDGKLLIGPEEFGVFIAHSSAIRPGTRKMIEEFISGGGCAVIITTARGFQNLTGATHISAQNLNYQELHSAIKTLLLHQVPSDVKILRADGSIAEDIRCHERIDLERHTYFLANVGDIAEKFTLEVDYVGRCEIWDPETGVVMEAETVETSPDKTKVAMRLAQYQSLLLILNESKPVLEFKNKIAKQKVVHTFAEEWVFSPLSPNPLPLVDWNLKIKSVNGAQRMEYSTHFICEHVPEKLEILLDDIEYRSSLMGSMDLTVSANDKTFDNPGYGFYLDEGFKTLDITDAVVYGQNHITINIAHSAWAGQPHFLNAPAYLLGNFCFSVDSNTIYSPREAAMYGSWTNDGYPFYSGAVDYSQSFRLGKIQRGARLILCIKEVQDFVEVLVDGKLVGTRLWSPWEVDITDFVTSGRHVLTLRVYNSMVNFISLEQKTSGLLGDVVLISRQIGQ